MTTKEVMEQINYLKSIIEDEIRVSDNKVLEKKYNKILNETKLNLTQEVYEKEEEDIDYRTYEYEPWR